MTKKTTPDASAQATPDMRDPTDRPHHASLALRILLFAAAFALAVAGFMGLTSSATVQSSAQIATAESIQAVPVRHVLVLYAFDEADAALRQARSGIDDTLARAAISHDDVYLDSRASAHDAALAQAIEGQLVAQAVSAGGYSAIIAAGDDALAFVESHQDLFAGVPCAFLAVSDAGAAQSAQSSGLATGIVEKGAASLALSRVASLVPAATRAVVLTDGSAASTALLAQVDPAAAQAAGSSATAATATSTAPASPIELDVWDVSRLTRDELAARLEALGDDAVVLLLSAGTDAEGNAYTASATAHFVGEHAPVPVFSASGGVGEGVTGASFVNRADEGTTAATLAVDLINGRDVATMDVQTVEPTCMVYDVVALSAAGIDPDATPAGDVLANEPALSWRTIRPLLVPIGLLLGALACVIVFGIIGFRQSLQSNQAIIQSRDDLRHRLYHDLLTELPNRFALERFAADTANVERMQSVAQVDIVGFSDINDSFGHVVGNEVIREVARRLGTIACSRLVRSGGDEFVLVFDHKIEEASAEVRQMLAAFSEQVVVGENAITVAPRIGIANRRPNMSSEDLVVYSDLAIKNAKLNSSRHPVFYDASMRESMERKIQITETLRQAIANDGVEVVWQPQVRAATLEVCGYEALCRLKGNPYSPVDFIPVAEMSGLVAPLDRAVTRTVIEQMGRWIADGLMPGATSINFSVAQLRDRDYCDFLEDLLTKHKVPAELIKIEVTESMLLGNEEAADELFGRLRKLGVTLALDDFGTGYSSLARLTTLPVDVVKLDKSLVDAFMVPGEEDFIEHVTQLVHDLGKTLVVEGVETIEQLDICQRLGCDVIQGYVFSRPVSAAAAIGFDPEDALKTARRDADDQTRNHQWSKYGRDSRGRWTKKS